MLIIRKVWLKIRSFKTTYYPDNAFKKSITKNLCNLPKLMQRLVFSLMHSFKFLRTLIVSETVNSSLWENFFFSKSRHLVLGEVHIIFSTPLRRDSSYLLLSFPQYRCNSVSKDGKTNIIHGHAIRDELKNKVGKETWHSNYG